MSYGFLDRLSTPSVRNAQDTNGSGAFWRQFGGNRKFDRLTEAEVAFIARRDSFYMATVGDSGWPYVQHRGGPAGFLRVLDETTLAFADFAGNRQYISVGNLADDNRTSLFLMDYPARRRLKILARAQIRAEADDPDLAASLATGSHKARIERLVILHLEAFDWNCPQHITPRFTESELSEVLAPSRERIASLETEIRRLRGQIGTEDFDAQTLLK